MSKKNKSAFTLVEILVASTIMALILFFAYKIFFAQTKTVTQTIGALQTNEGFRRVLAFMGDDVRESTRIVKPTPINVADIPSVKTTTGSILIVQSSDVDPRIRFDSPLGGQISQITTIEYFLEAMEKKNTDENSNADENLTRYRLVRNATIEEKNGEKSRQRQIIADNIKEFYVYRTVRKPFKPINVVSMSDNIINKIPLSEAGTGNSLIHVRMVIERARNSGEQNKENIYTLTMNTSFYKRGKEIFLHP